MKGWIGVDLDGTLAKYDGWRDGIGEPVLGMVLRVQKWLDDGLDVRIVTARVAATGLVSPMGVLDDEAFASKQQQMIEDWCFTHIGRVLPVTASKDMYMLELWDDRAIQVELNTGIPLGFSRRGLE